jgi:hypothetical protein
MRRVKSLSLLGNRTLIPQSSNQKSSGLNDPVIKIYLEDARRVFTSSGL